MMFTQSRPAQLSLLIKRFCRASFLIVLGLAFSQVTEAAPRKSVEKIRAEQVELQQEATEFLQKLGERLEKLGQKEEAQQAFESAQLTQ